MGSIKFNFQKSPSPDDSRLFPRFVPVEIVNIDRIIDRISNACSLTRADISGCLEALKYEIIFHIQSGCSVDLDPFFTISPVLGYKGETQDADSYQPSKVYIKRLKIVPKGKFFDEIAKGQQFEKCPSLSGASFAASERLERTVRLIAVQPTASDSVIAAYNHCSRATADRDIAMLISQGRIRRIARGYFQATEE